MTTSSMSTMDIKKINNHNIYTFIYQHEHTSRQNIVDKLHISLSTVTQNLKSLENEGLIHHSGYYESTGGRKANTYEIVKDAKIALGIDILKESVHVVAVDLYGNVIKKAKPFSCSISDENFYHQLGRIVSDFITQENWSPDRLLGAGIAIQGIPDENGTALNYAPLIDNSSFHFSTLAKYIPCQCRLIHDCKSAAMANLWHNKNLTNAVMLLLNPSLGGALIINRSIYNGQNMRGGLLEHISFDPNGDPCYCGSRGCLETICSINSLKKRSGMELEEFFHKLRGGDTQVYGLWTDYLEHLAFAIRNLHIILDMPVIISGLLTNYMIEEDFDILRELINKHSPFLFPQDFLIPGPSKSLASAIGSALYFVDQWLQTL